MTATIDLAGRLALVTGGSRGIGAAVVRRLAAAGARVAFSWRADEGAARALAAELPGSLALRADLDDPEAGPRLVEEVEAATGASIDILVANAGIWEHTPLAELDLETLRRTLRVNLESVVLACRRVAPAMAAKGWGRIVMIGSTAGQRGEAEHAAYALSKGALQLFARSIATELASCGIVVNTVAPGWVVTDMSERAMRDGGEARIAATIPRGRVALPDEIAGPVLFLCSDLCSHMIGSVLSVNGGAVMA